VLSTFPIQVVSGGPKTLQEMICAETLTGADKGGSLSRCVFAPGSGRIPTIQFTDCQQTGTYPETGLGEATIKGNGLSMTGTMALEDGV
jgi:hypothetical protein